MFDVNWFNVIIILITVQTDHRIMINHGRLDLRAIVVVIIITLVCDVEALLKHSGHPGGHRGHRLNISRIPRGCRIDGGASRRPHREFIGACLVRRARKVS